MENTEFENEKMEDEVIEENQDNVTELKKEENAEVDYKQKYFYLAAEMDNLRKRLDREKSQIIKFGSESILKDLVQVLDTFELTVNAIKMDKDEKVQNIVVGLDMVSKQFEDALKNHGLEKIDCLGKEFDPNFHEAVSKEDAEKAKTMEVIKVAQSGYTLNGRTIRASKVIVAN